MSRCTASADRICRQRHDTDDSGFTILEVIVAIVLITIVMTAMAAFFVNSAKATENQSQRQSAVQIAQDAIEQARALSGIGLTTGRDSASSDALWAQGKNTSSTTAFPGVAPYLSSVAEVWDVSNPAAVSGQPAGYTAALPTDGNIVALDGINYTQNWFLGACYSAQSVSSGQCAATSATGTTKYIQVVVAVTWTANSCPSSANRTCSYITATRVSPTPDPLFDSNQSAPKPRIVNPGNQTSGVGDTVALTLTVSGGTAPLTWSATGLPAGLTLYPGVVTTIGGQPTTLTADPAQVVVTVTDVFGFISTAAFTWTVSNPVTLTNPGNRTSAKGSAVSLALVYSGGTTPDAFTATGLPAGLTINTTSGVISGSPTTLTGLPSTVAVTLTDSRNRTSTVAFTWTITAQLAILTPAAQNDTTGVVDSVTLTATGGTSPYKTWTATGLPPGLTINSSGTISGAPTSAAAYTVTVTVTDTDGTTASTTAFSWKVTNPLAFTNPGTLTFMRSTAVSQQLASSGGTTPYTYTLISGTLPAGLALSSTGLLAGTPNANTAGTSVTVNVTDSLGRTDSGTFTIKVITPLVIAGATAETSEVGVADSKTLTGSGGTGTYTRWTVTGQPAGMTINATGVITGTPTASCACTATVTVTDSGGNTAGASFAWTAYAALNLVNPGTQSTAVNATPSLQSLTVTGGSGGLSWGAANLPPGVSLDSSTGLLSGRPTAGYRYLSTIAVTDSTGASDAETFVWTVTGGITITLNASNTQSSNAGSTITSYTPTATGGYSGLFSASSWSDGGSLPPGVSISNSGVVSGRPTTPGTYTVTLTYISQRLLSVTLSGNYMFTWTVS